MTPVPTSKISNNIRLSERVDKIQTIAPGFLPCGIKTFRYGIPGFLCGINDTLTALLSLRVFVSF